MANETSIKGTSLLLDIPDELIEHIAFFVGTSTLLGPPSALPTLIRLNKRFHRVLNISNNPHLYARIFISKFDVATPLRRFRALHPNSDTDTFVDGRNVVVGGELTVTALAAELVRRCRVLRRIRAQLDFVSLGSGASGSDSANAAERDAEAPTLDETLWTAYLMMLENDKKNLIQLREHAWIDLWLRTYWSDPRGWGAKQMSGQQWPQQWPKNDTRAALAMWLFWFFLDPAKCFADVGCLKQTYNFIKPIALGAHKYPLSTLPWTSFTPELSHIHFGVPGIDSFAPFDPIRRRVSLTTANPLPPKLFSVPFQDLTPLPASVPAILAYLSLRAYERSTAAFTNVGLAWDGAPTGGADDMLGQHLGFMVDVGGGEAGRAFVAFPQSHNEPSSSSRTGANRRPTSTRSRSRSSRGEEADNDQAGELDKRWDYEWTRALPVEPSVADMYPARTFLPGSIEGVWEGIFSYTEFTSYAALLAGGPPSTLQNTLVAQHSQTWRIREHHLLADVPFSSPSHQVSTPYITPGNLDNLNLNPLPIPAGDPLRGYLPENATIDETREGVTVTLPAPTSGTSSLRPSRYAYTRYSPELVKEHGRRCAEGGVEYGKRVRDILLIGEGHSSWGEFRLVGRVRRCDGFVSVSKVYTNGDRGRWLYRGYLVGVPSEGDSYGYLVGRWRDTLTPMETHGYEGCFGMTRRH